MATSKAVHIQGQHKSCVVDTGTGLKLLAAGKHQVCLRVQDHWKSKPDCSLCQVDLFIRAGISDPHPHRMEPKGEKVE